MASGCVGCLSAMDQPSGCVASACSSSLSVCGSGSVPAVTIRGSDLVDWPCNVLCVASASATATVTSITCRTAFPYRDGMVSVSVSGLESAPLAIDYDDLLSVPELNGTASSPATTPSDGGVVTLFGRHLASTEVHVRNAVSAAVVATLTNTGSSISVSCEYDVICVWYWIERGRDQLGRWLPRSRAGSVASSVAGSLARWLADLVVLFVVL